MSKYSESKWWVKIRYDLEGHFKNKFEMPLSASGSSEGSPIILHFLAMIKSKTLFILHILIRCSNSVKCCLTFENN